MGRAATLRGTVSTVQWHQNDCIGIHKGKWVLAANARFGLAACDSISCNKTSALQFTSVWPSSMGQTLSACCAVLPCAVLCYAMLCGAVHFSKLVLCCYYRPKAQQVPCYGTRTSAASEAWVNECVASGRGAKFGVDMLGVTQGGCIEPRYATWQLFDFLDIATHFRLI